MTKVTLNNVGSLIDATTAATTINNNSSTITTAFDNTLSRDGTAPNTMSAPIDMNGKNILNLPAATAAGEPVTFEVFEAALIGHGNVPLGGTTGQVLAKTSNTDFATAWTSESAEISAGTNIAVTGGSPAIISTVTNPTFVSPSITTPIGIVKADVGLSNVDNTSDVTKNAAAVTLTNKTIAGANNTLNVRIGQDVSGLGTGLQTALGVAVGSAGAPVLFNGAGGTPSSITLTNATGTAASLTAGSVTTNANLTGDVTSVGNATTLTNAPVISKVLTGYVSGAGTVAATDTILQAIQKLNGNNATNANLTGDVTSVGNATTLATVNANTGSWGTATQVPQITLNGKGLTTAASNVTITPAVGSITGLGSNVATFLGTPSSANLAAALTDESGSGVVPFQTTGSWTPADGSGAALTFTGVSANYTRIGNMVFAYAQLTYPTTASAITAVISGLPFTVPNQDYASQGHFTRNDSGSFWTLAPVKNTTNITMFSAGGAALQNVNITGLTLKFIVTYPIA